MKLKKIMPIIVLVLTIMITGCGREKVDYNQTSTDINRINLFDVELEKQKIDFNKIKLEGTDKSSGEIYYYYLKDDEVFIVHLFDPSQEEYKKIEKQGYITSKGGIKTNTDVICNNGLVLEQESNVESFAKIIEKFKSVK